MKKRKSLSLRETADTAKRVSAPPAQGSGDNGNVTGYTFTDNQNSSLSHTATYCYDALDRLTQAIATGNSTYNLTFSYDQYGNMSCTTNASTHGPCNNVGFNTANNHINTTGYGYDAAGNLTQDPTNVPTNTYQWDAEGRMTAIVQSGTTFETNTYNSLGQMVEADYPGFNAKVLPAFDPSGRELGEYNGVGAYWWDQDVWAGGRMLAQEATGTTNFLHANTIGSDTQVTNGAGAVLTDMLFYPWGQVWQAVPSMVDSHFAGFQKSAGPIYGTPNRSYLDSVGRWLTPDPGGVKVVKLDDPQSWNAYSYALNNPTRYTDPLGLYVTNCAEGDKKCQAQAQSFESARQADLNSRDKAVQASAAAYGDPGEKNGVTVSFVNKLPGNEAGETTGGISADASGHITPDVQVKILTGQSVEELQGTVGHEGSHVEDDLALIRSITPSGSDNPALNITQYQTEFRAYQITAAIARSLGTTISLGPTGRYTFSPSDLPTQVNRTINGFLEDPANHYNLTPQNPGPKIFPLLP